MIAPAVTNRTQAMLDGCIHKNHQAMLIDAVAHIEVEENGTLYIVTRRKSWHRFAFGSYIESFTVRSDSENGHRVTKLVIGIPIPSSWIPGMGISPSHTATQEVDL